MKVLVINAGSSSLKYQLIDMDNQVAIAKGLCERIGIDGSSITHKTSDGRKVVKEIDFPTHVEAFNALKEILVEGEGKVLGDLSEIGAVGHRVVHGGEKFTKSTLITEEVLKELDALSELAPLHNPANITAIRSCQAALGEGVPHVAVFDTSFHQTMPAKAFTYGLPYKFYEEDSIRRYGFHGTSHRFISQRYANLVSKKPEDLKIVTCHLGNGSSLAAVDGGKSIDTTMGFTPLAGLLMGTRSGDLDPSILPYIASKHNLTLDEISNICNKESGFLGISGISSDARDLIAAREEGNERAGLALDMLAYQITKYIGAYAAAMNGLDAILFTGGIGENDENLRAAVCENLSFMGVKIDKQKNIDMNHGEANLTAEGATVQTWIVPTDEELMIALDTVELTK